ncbi:MAG: hypothetical protein WDA27_07585 [Actinomycetota bacterium]
MDATEIKPDTRAKRWIVAVAVGAVLLVTLAVAVALRSRTNKQATAASLPTRTVSVGSIEIEVRPRQLDTSGIRFQVELTTHSGNLGMTPRGRLEIAGLAWAGGTWTGDPPGGHHRSGVLAFSRGGPTNGILTLTLEGFAEPVVLNWEI